MLRGYFEADAWNEMIGQVKAMLQHELKEPKDNSLFADLHAKNRLLPFITLLGLRVKAREHFCWRKSEYRKFIYYKEAKWTGIDMRK